MNNEEARRTPGPGVRTEPIQTYAATRVCPPFPGMPRQAAPILLSLDRRNCSKVLTSMGLGNGFEDRIGKADRKNGSKKRCWRRRRARLHLRVIRFGWSLSQDGLSRRLLNGHEFLAFPSEFV
jgi:hypothetical protein